MKVYVASSWRNKKQPEVVSALREIGLDVYDFRNPAPGNHGFHWSKIDKDWKTWTPTEFMMGLKHRIAEDEFQSDLEAIETSDICVLCLPGGRSSHLEAGYFVGAKKKLLILVTEEIEPELMYKMADYVATSIKDISSWITCYCAPRAI